MNNEVNVPLLISPNCLDSSSSVAPISSTSLISEISNCSSMKNECESTTEANDVLKNGILIQTNKGVELLSLTEALKSGVGGLILSVEDFQNVAAHLLHSQSSVRQIVNSGENAAPAQSFVRNNSKLETIPDASEYCKKAKVANEDLKLLIMRKGVNNAMPTDKHVLREVLKTSSNSLSITVSESVERNTDSSAQSDPTTQVKKKGGWPKGKKRKPALADNNKPPKAPCTGYVYYLNENRKRPEFQTMAHQEVIKALGNEWSNLCQEDRREYLERAEVDKRRYQEELKVYRNSDTYRSQLKRRRAISNNANGSEESDFDTTDGIDDDDNEDLYCGACNQWFITLHNKKEHLSGKQHFQVLSQTGKGSSSLGRMSLDGPSITNLQTLANTDVSYVPDAMTNFFHNIAEREREIKALQESLRISEVKKKQILKQLQELKQTQTSLQKLSSRQKEEESKLDKVISSLREVPTMFSTEKNLNLILPPHTAIIIRTVSN